MQNKLVSYRVGDALVTRIFETLITDFTLSELYPAWNEQSIEESARLSPLVCWDDEHQHVVMNTHSWLIRTPEHNVLIDAGIGNHKKRKSACFNQLNNPFLERLAVVGVKPEDIDYVLLTHLHTDHVGWNTMLDGNRWVPTFPKAKYVFSKVEDALFSGPNGQMRPNYPIYEDSVLPVIQSGQALMIEGGGGEFKDGFSFRPTPGHSPDHLSISFRSRGEHALFAGDVLHLPIQVKHPGLSSSFSADPEQGRISRISALEYAAHHKALFFSSHCPGTSAGRIQLAANQFSWQVT